MLPFSNPNAQCTYTDMGKRVSAILGALIVQTVAASGATGGYSGLDRFGRITDLHYQKTSDLSTVHRYEYGYDQAGNRTYAKVTQQGHDNDRSWLYEYDGLHRLVSADYGQLNPGHSAIVPTPGQKSTSWNLDNLGNWSGDGDPDASGSQSVVSEVDTDGDGDADTSSYVHHEVNPANELLEVVTNATASTLLRNDAAGSITHDGSYIYQYDGLNRLIQINQPGTASFDPQGRITGGSLGTLVFRWVYDGLGRVIRKEWTPSAASTSVVQVHPGWGGGSTASGTPASRADYYYDGVRRIQEIYTAGTTQSTERESVYGPGGAGGTGGDVNELVLQMTSSCTPYYVLQDANLNVVGLTGGTGILLSQWTYDPYGQVLATETPNSPPFSVPPMNRVGFQGMFTHRLDAPASAPLTVGATIVNETPNRIYRPDWGRWVQNDPNATAQPILEALARNGSAISVFGGGLFDLASHYDDGPNGYLFVRSNPIDNRDPTGLLSLLEGAEVAGIQGIALGLVSGAISKYTRDDFWSGFRTGAAAGVLGGGAAFAASLSGLVGTVGVIGLDGFVAGYGMSSMSGGDYGQNLAEGLFGMIAGVATGGMLEALGGIGSLVFRTGDEAADYLHRLVGGLREAKVKGVPRTHDIRVGNKAIEVKLGAQKITDHTRKQVLNDNMILDEMVDGITEFEWHFYRSANTGLVGPDPALEQALNGAGIRPIIHD